MYEIWNKRDIVSDWTVVQDIKRQVTAWAFVLPVSRGFPQQSLDVLHLMLPYQLCRILAADSISHTQFIVLKSLILFTYAL